MDANSDFRQRCDAVFGTQVWNEAVVKIRGILSTPLSSKGSVSGNLVLILLPRGNSVLSMQALCNIIIKNWMKHRRKYDEIDLALTSFLGARIIGSVSEMRWEKDL